MMMRNFLLYIISSTLFIPVFVFPQLPDSIPLPAVNIEQNIETLIESLEEDADLTEIAEELDFYRENPLNLNSASAEELSRLTLLNPIQIENFISYRRRHGLLKTPYELVYIDGFDMPTIQRLLTFSHVAPVSVSKGVRVSDLKRGRHQLFIRYQEILDEQKGFSSASDSLLEASPNSRYLGSPQKIYMRYGYKLYNRLSFGITAEKDAGEEFFTGNRKDGFDFYSAHLAYTGNGLLRTAIIGDYSVNMAQGLVCYSGMSFGKGASVLNIRKRSSVLRRYTSVDENRFFRGAAATLAKGSFELTGFISHKRVDARLENYDDLDSEEAYISSLQETGLHRTPSELANRRTVKQGIYGGRLSYNRRIINVGFSHVAGGFDKPIGEKSQLYQSFNFQGKKISNTGIDFSINFRNILLFGEGAINRSGEKALLGGMLFSLAPGLSLSMLYRDYSKAYSGLFLNGFGEASGTANERGLYTGLLIQPINRLSISLYSDFFRFPWMRYRVDKPSFGKEYFVQAEYQLSRRVQMYVRYKTETKLLNPSGSTEVISRPGEQIRQNFRYNIDYRIATNIRLRTRFDASGYSLADKNSRGYLMFQDFIYEIPQHGLTLYFRYALFDTDDFDTRIYTYENDLLYTFSVPSFFDRGVRTYGMIRYRINRYADLWVKLSQTAYTDRHSIGSGLTEIEGNKRTELRAQLRLRW